MLQFILRKISVKALKKKKNRVEMRPFTHFSIRYADNQLQILDQTLLPDEERWLTAASYKDMYDFIKRLAIRGAPAIGVAASLSLAQEASRGLSDAELRDVAEHLRSARPTAVNLMHCIDRLVGGPEKVLSAATVIDEAYQIMEEEVQMNLRMAELGASLVQHGENIATHCNTGALATPGVGTALGVIRLAHRAGKGIHVWVDETRPLLQGGRLTAFELHSENIPHTLICDNMIASLMREGKVQRVFVGADRIAANGDFANKIGTYGLAVIARHHGVPFHVVAPVSTVDVETPDGAHIEIEQRSPDEVRGASGAFGKVRWAPAGSPVFNPAFDVTPAELVTSLILDTGIYTTEQLKQHILKTVAKPKNRK